MTTEIPKDFTPWRGDEGMPCPLPPDTLVEVRFRDGDYHVGSAGYLDWSWGLIVDEVVIKDHTDADIIGYRTAYPLRIFACWDMGEGDIALIVADSYDEARRIIREDYEDFFEEEDEPKFEEILDFKAGQAFYFNPYGKGFPGEGWDKEE